METIFLVLLFTVIYAFLGYPVVVVILSLLLPQRIRKQARDDLSVSLIITAYNEEKVIENKIRNSLALDYPRALLEIVVASDGSTDRTERIASSFFDLGVKLLRVDGRKGKTETQNQAVRQAKGEILIFSDANGMYRSDAVRKIVANFSDPRVGCVCGRLVYSSSGSETPTQERTYWDLENLLKEKESDISSVLGANGSIYAVRKDLYVPLRPDMISDLVEPCKIIETGFRAVYERLAVSVEELSSVSGGLRQAFRRKVRIQTRSMVGLVHCLGLLHFSRYGLVSFQFFSHKILRYLVPFILPLLFVLNLLILGSSVLAVFCFLIQGLFYALSVIGYLMQRAHRGRNNVFSIPWYFVWTHAAALVSGFRLLRGKKVITWDTVR